MHLITPLLIDLSIVALAMAGVLMLAWKLLQHLWGTGATAPTSLRRCCFPLASPPPCAIAFPGCAPRTGNGQTANSC